MSEEQPSPAGDIPHVLAEKSAAPDTSEASTTASAAETVSTTTSPPSPKRGWVRSRVGKVAATVTLGAGLLIGGYYALKKAAEVDPMAERARDIDLLKINIAIREYRAAVEACMDDPKQETAQELDGASMKANLAYLALHGRLDDLVKGDAVADITRLHEEAKKALEGIDPRTRYVQHYLDRLATRHSAILLRVIGAREEEEKVWKAALKESDDRNERLKNFTTEERQAYMRQPVEAPKK